MSSSNAQSKSKRELAVLTIDFARVWADFYFACFLFWSERDGEGGSGCRARVGNAINRICEVLAELGGSSSIARNLESLSDLVDELEESRAKSPLRQRLESELAEQGILNDASDFMADCPEESSDQVFVAICKDFEEHAGARIDSALYQFIKKHFSSTLASRLIKFADSTIGKQCYFSRIAVGQQPGTTNYVEWCVEMNSLLKAIRDELPEVGAGLSRLIDNGVNVFEARELGENVYSILSNNVELPVVVRLHYLDLSLNLDSVDLFRDGYDEPSRLTKQGSEIVQALAKSQGARVARERIRDLCKSESDAAIYKAISSTRKAIEPLGLEIKTAKSEGYRLIDAGA